MIGPERGVRGHRNEVGRPRLSQQLVELAELAPEKQAHGDGDEPSFNPWQEDLYRAEPEP
jgi:hypothetical protein